MLVIYNEVLCSCHSMDVDTFGTSCGSLVLIRCNTSNVTAQRCSLLLLLPVLCITYRFCMRTDWDNQSGDYEKALILTTEPLERVVAVSYTSKAFLCFQLDT